MDGDKFRSYRDRDPVAREAPEQTSRGEIGDLLVELARLTGQGDPYANVSRDGGSSGLDWAADDAAPEQRQQGEGAPRPRTIRWVEPASSGRDDRRSVFAASRPQFSTPAVAATATVAVRAAPSPKPPPELC